LAQKSEAAAAKKVKQIEDEMDALRVQHRNTPEAALTQQVAELKGQLADRERKIEVLKAERGQIIAEKEQFRINVRKLVSPFDVISLDYIAIYSSANHQFRQRPCVLSVIKQQRRESKYNRTFV
jgi:hypothetical protein